MRRLASLLLLATLAPAAAAHAQPAAERPDPPARGTVERIHWEAVDGRGRLVVGVRGTVDYSTHVAGADAATGMPPRAYVDLRPAVIGRDVPRTLAVDDSLARRIRVGQFDPQTVRVVVDLAAPALFEVSTSERPPRLLLALRRREAREQVAVKQRLEDPAASAPQEEHEAAQAAPAPSPRAAEGTVEIAAAPASPATAPRAEPPRAVAAASPSPAPTAAPSVAPPRATPAGARATPQSAPVVLAEGPPEDVAAAGKRSTELARRDDPAPAKPPAGSEAERGTGPGAAGATGKLASLAPAGAPPETAARRGKGRGQPKSARRAPRPQPSPPVWTVVIDPGHGGRDPGASGVTGEQEKNVTLALSQLVAETLAADPQIRVVLTRTDDSYVSLEQRTAIANANGADLFVSVHANASENPQLAGIETYTLNNTDDRATIRLAALENGLALTGAAPGERDLAYILSDLVQTGKEDESVAAARAVQGSLVSYLQERWKGVQNLGVKKGPFYVLVGAYMPCILVETAFLTNETEGQRIAARRYQIDVADGIARGIRRFLASETANANL